MQIYTKTERNEVKMFTNFDIKNARYDSDTIKRLSDYEDYRNLYDGDFTKAFSSTVLKIRKRYPLDNTTAQSLININLFWALTDFFKGFLTNQGITVNVDDAKQSVWDEISKENNFISVLKEVYIDNSRFGNGIFKAALENGKVKIFSVCPDCWIPVFKQGNLNDIEGHILVYPLEIIENGAKKEFKKVEKHHKGYVENEIWTSNNGTFGRLLEEDEMAMFNTLPIDDFSDYWEDFLVFPTKNTTESDSYFGESDYKRCKSIVEEIMLTVSQNSKIINRHANPKLSGSEQNLEMNPVTNERIFPDTDFLKVGTDGIKPEYITADLQADAIQKHLDMLMSFFYILTKTPPQAYGLDISGNMSGESLRKIFIAALSKVDDIKQVSFTSTIQNVVKCAMALNSTPVDSVNVAWGEPIPSDYSEMVATENSRVAAGTQSKLTTIMTLDNVSEEDAMAEIERINEEQNMNSQDGQMSLKDALEQMRNDNQDKENPDTESSNPIETEEYKIVNEKQKI